MAIRFTLLERTGADGFGPLKAPGLGRWRRAKPGVVSFGYRQVVKALPGTPSTRCASTSAGAPPTAACWRRSSALAPCRQFSALPNLEVEVLAAAAHQGRGGGALPGAGHERGAAGSRRRFASPSTARIDTAGVTLLPGEARELNFRGPACTAPVTAAAEPDGTIVESSETDNVHELACRSRPP